MGFRDRIVINHGGSKNPECFIAATAKGCDMDTLFNEEAANPPGKYCARPINGMGDSPPRRFQPAKGVAIPTATVEPSTEVRTGDL